MAYVKKRKTLRNEEVYKLICATLERFDLPLLPRLKLLPLFREMYPLPIIIEEERITVWIDRDYIAYSYPTEHEVHYVYVNKQHIIDEKSQMDNPIVRESFIQAQRQMNTCKRNYAIFPLWE